MPQSAISFVKVSDEKSDTPNGTVIYLHHEDGSIVRLVVPENGEQAYKVPVLF